MKSPEVYAVLRNELAPMLKTLGFKREKALLSWSREHDGQYTVMWCQVSRDGWDEYAGSKFVIEFQRSSSGVAGAPATYRERITKLLSNAQREEVRRFQNAVISSLDRPQPNHPTLHISPDVSRWYLAKFEPVAEPYTNGDDIWFRYSSTEHIKAWAALLAKVIPYCIRSMEGAGESGA